MTRKEIMGYDSSVTSVREVRDGDPQRFKEPLWGGTGYMEDPQT